MPRTPQEIFRHHLSAVAALDLDEILADFTDDAVLITPRGVLRGKTGVREGYTAVMAELPNAKVDVPTQIFAGDVLFIEWTAESDKGRVTDGVDTFVFADDGIRAQTIRFTLQPSS